MTTLYPYQVEGQAFLAERESGLLADEQGLGKTAQAIAAADSVGAKSILVICPASARINWERELARWLVDPQAVDTKVVSYDKARGSQRDGLMEKAWDVLILDEAHFLKSWKAKRTQTIYGALCDGKGGLVSRSKYIWALSGTPAPNDVTELWPMMRALFPTSLVGDKPEPMSLWDFTSRYTTGYQTKYGYRVTGGRNLEELKERLVPHMLRRKTEEVLPDLPPIRYGEVTLNSGELPAGLREAEEGFEGDVIRAALEAGKLPPSAMMATSTLRRLTGLAKVTPVIDLVTYELNSNPGKLVLFAHHREVINQLNWGLAEFNPCLLHGGLPEDQRQKAVDDFQKDPTARVFIGQLTAAGTAITLTAAASVLFVEYSWTPSDNQQAAKRCHRIGQTDSVLVRFVSLAGSLDEDITRVVRDKTETLSKVID